MNNRTELENIIGYTFNNKNQLRLALTHSSYANENGMGKYAHNERIEFLGDAVLELISSDFLFKEYPDMQEGDMTKLRSKLVCEDALSYFAKQIGLGRFLYLGKGEEHTNGRERKSILCDAFESLIGAIYIDGGMEAATKFVKRFVLSDIEQKMYMFDSKTTLQEMVQAKYGVGVVYKVIEESGPEHNKSFRIAVYIKDKLMGEGFGHSKKEAAKEAAYQTILMLNSTDDRG